MVTVSSSCSLSCRSHDTLSSQDASTHQIWDSCLKDYRISTSNDMGFATNTIILKTRHKKLCKSCDEDINMSRKLLYLGASNLAD